MHLSLSAPIGQDCRLQVVTYAPPILAGGQYVAEYADSVEFLVSKPDGTELDPIAGVVVQDEDGNPVVGTYQATIRPDAEGLWRGICVFVLAGGEQGVVTFEITAFATRPQAGV